MLKSNDIEFAEMRFALLPGDESWSVRARLAEHGLGVFAARAGGDQKCRGQQDRDRQRRGDKYGRCLHGSPIAVLITARWRAGIANDLENDFDYAGSGIAMLTLIESTVRATIMHSDSEPKASVAATASFSLDACCCTEVARSFQTVLFFDSVQAVSVAVFVVNVKVSQRASRVSPC